MKKMLWGLLFLTLAVTCSAQVDKGRITGTVIDATGAMIPGVTVSAMNIETGVAFAVSVTNGAGEYDVLNLPIGHYAVRFTKDGFATLERSNIAISIGQAVRLNASLRPGAVMQNITVSSDASPMQLDTSDTGTTMNSSALTTLPLSIAGGRDISTFAFKNVPTVSGTNFSSSIAGSMTKSKVVMVDGTDADAGIQGTQTPPGLDAVQQFQVETSGISAEASQTGGGAFMYELKSGTNGLHGSAFAFDHNEAFDANTWQNDFFKSYCSNSSNSNAQACLNNPNYNKARNRYDDYGFSLGGPLWKKHTFLFGAWERYGQTDLRESAPDMTVPTGQMLGGDFSQILDTKTQVTNTAGILQYDKYGNPVYKGAIFNPMDPGAVFAGNIVPQISPQSAKVIALYQKDYKPVTSTVINNFPTLLNGQPFNNNTHFDIKADHNFSPNHHLSISSNYYSLHTTNCGDCNTPWQIGSHDGGPLSGGQLTSISSEDIRLIDSYTIRPTLLNVFSAGWNYYIDTDTHTADVNAASLGFTSEISNASNQMPELNFQSPGGIGVNESVVSGRFNTYPYLFDQWHWKDTVSWEKGLHVFKFGGEFITYSANGYGGSGLTNYGFSPSTGMPLSLINDTLASNLLGFGLANFELGEVYTSGQVDGTALIGGIHGRRKGMSFFAEDTIRVSPKLTLNASLRWDINLPMHEIDGRWPDFNLDATNSTWAPVLQSYGLSGKGAISYLSNGSQSWEKSNNYHQFGPHIGAAYHVSDKWVARGAFGLSYIPLGMNQWGGLPYAIQGDFGYVPISRAPAAANASVAAFQWDQNIYPGTITPATQDSNANAIDPWAGGSASLNPDRLSLGRTQNWNVTVEHQFSTDTIIDFTYVGMHGSNLHDGELDPRQYPAWQKLQSLATAGQSGAWISSQSGASAASAACNCTVPWLPFLINATNGYGGYTAGAAMGPYPQITGDGPILFADSALGVSNYHALIAEVKKTRGHGIISDLSYTYSRATGNVVDNIPGATNGGNMSEGWIYASPFQDPFSYNSSEAIGTINPGDARHQVKGYVVYQLPFGHGERWINHGSLVSSLVGGWNMGAQLSYHSGNPMAAVNNSFGYGGWSQVFANVNQSSHNLTNHFSGLNLANPSDSKSLFFNPSAFTNVAIGSFGNQQPYYDNWRGWASYDEDASLVKHFSVRERYQITLRGEFFNVLNRHYWGNPDTNINSSTFGHVLGVSGNRTGQVGARFEF